MPIGRASGSNNPLIIGSNPMSAILFELLECKSISVKLRGCVLC